MTEDDLRRAHIHCTSNRPEVRASELCGCFYCLAVFTPDEIDNWIGDAGGGTAMCPYCVIDSVIGSASGFSLTPEFLARMNQYWFGDASTGGT